jgi:hypothetical protein
MKHGTPRIIDSTPSGLVYFGQFIDHDLTQTSEWVGFREYSSPSARIS